MLAVTLATALAVLALHAPLPSGVTVQQRWCPDYWPAKVNCVHQGDGVVYVNPAMKADGGQTEWLAALAHELGHVWDYQHMDDVARERYSAFVGRLDTRWLAPSEGFAEVPPGEEFADIYALCAIGARLRSVYALDRSYYGQHGEVMSRPTVAATCWLLDHPPR